MPEGIQDKDNLQDNLHSFKQVLTGHQTKAGKDNLQTTYLGTILHIK